MGLYQPDENTGFIHSHAVDIDRQLREGDGIHWSGDQRLELRMGILEAPRTMWFEKFGRIVRKGEILARRYEIWRHGEDGEDHLIRTYRLEEVDRIIFDLAPMRLDSPAHVDAITEIDKHNNAIERANAQETKERMLEGLEHQIRLWHDTNLPRNRFRGMPGMRDSKEETCEPATAETAEQS